MRTVPEKESAHLRKVQLLLLFNLRLTPLIKHIHELNLADMETLQQLSVYVANFEKKSFKVDLTANSSSVGPVGKKSGGY